MCSRRPVTRSCSSPPKLARQYEPRPPRSNPPSRFESWMRPMKGGVLAGGKATRLRPLTKVTNKHLLPIYDKPLIYYPLQAMARAGVRDVLVITNPEHAGHFIQLLGSGSEFGLKLAYELQEEAGGLAQAVGLAQTFVGGDKMLVLLGDNIFTHDLRPAVERFSQQDTGSVIFGIEAEHP